MASVGDYPLTSSGSLNIYTPDYSRPGYVQPFQLAQPGPSPYAPPWATYITVQPEEKKEPMRGVFEVFIVDPETGFVNVDHIVARDETTAKVKAITMFYPENKKDLDDYDYVVRRLGDVREKPPKKDKG